MFLLTKEKAQRLVHATDEGKAGGLQLELPLACAAEEMAGQKRRVRGVGRTK